VEKDERRKSSTCREGRKNRRRQTERGQMERGREDMGYNLITGRKNNP